MACVSNGIGGSGGVQNVSQQKTVHAECREVRRRAGERNPVHRLAQRFVGPNQKLRRL
jgi:hypothetical protein